MTQTPEALRATRVNLKLSLRAVARKMKISAQHLLDMERGYRRMSPALEFAYLKALKQPLPERPGITKAAAFVKVFPHPLISVEWRAKWPVEHANGKTYNPDFFSPALDCYIEVCTSWPNHAAERLKWQATILAGYRLRVYWWQGQDITEDVKNGCMGAEIRERHGISR